MQSESYFFAFFFGHYVEISDKTMQKFGLIFFISFDIGKSFNWHFKTIFVVVNSVIWKCFFQHRRTEFRRQSTWPTCATKPICPNPKWKFENNFLALSTHENLIWIPIVSKFLNSIDPKNPCFNNKCATRKTSNRYNKTILLDDINVQKL